MTDKKLRYGLIGVGANVYGMHRPGLELDHIEIAGVVDLRADVNERIHNEWHAPAFTDYRQMIEAIRPDVVVVMTPHPLHAPMTIDALEAGCHVLVEKPMADEVAQAEAMIAAAARMDRVLAVNFQQRLRPEIIAAKRLIDTGELGRIQHVDIKITWTRTAL
jgi:predicted dehydrogenase